jgi:hypothetical protein
MSFFGFNTDLPRDRGHQANAPGFGQHDAFAGFSGGAADDDVYVAQERAIDFCLPITTASTSRRPIRA